MKVSVLLLTYNEAENLPRCLDSLSWCDDIILVDSGSTDKTVEIAQARGVRILVRAFDDFANQRNYGLKKGKPRHDWVLHLDADEVVTTEMRDSLLNLDQIEGIDAYRIPSKLMFGGCWLRYSGMYPSYQVRLGHRDRLRFKQVGHGQREDLPPDRVATFDVPYLHYNFSRGLGEWFRKHVRYAEDEAELIISSRSNSSSNIAATMCGDSANKRRALKNSAARFPLFLRPLARFLYVLVWHRGFLDGRRGFLYAFMLTIYEGMVAVLAYEMLKNKSRNLDNTHSKRNNVQ